MVLLHNLTVFVFSSLLLHFIGMKMQTEMHLPVVSPVCQTLRSSLSLSFGMKILRAHLRI